MRVYFDNAATTPIEPAVIEKMARLMREVPGNPSSIHAEGRKARTVVEEARKTVANLLGASIGEIFFTSGGTESNNMALKCAVRDLGVERIISSPLEHHCVLHSLQRLEKERGTEVVWLHCHPAGQPDLEELESLLRDGNRKTLVSLMHINNEIGTLLDLEKVAALCEEYGALFHSDTVQSVGYYPIDLTRLNISFLSGSAHKFHGPKGTGFLYINSNNIIQPYLDGGSQERNMRGGTENVYGIAGLAEALRLACEERETRRQHINMIKSLLRARLLEQVEGLQFNSPEDEFCHYKIINVAFPPSEKSDMLLLLMDVEGISASGGSACASGAEHASHVLEAIKADPERKAVRFSFSHHNTPEEVDYVAKKLKEVFSVPIN